MCRASVKPRWTTRRSWGFYWRYSTVSVGPNERRPKQTREFMDAFLLLRARYSLGATCVCCRRCGTPKGKQFKLWWRIWTGTNYPGFEKPPDRKTAAGRHISMLPSTDSTEQTHTPTWRVRGWGRRPTRSNMFTFTGNGRDALAATLGLTRRSSCWLFPPLSPLSSRSNVLRVKELYQYPKPDGGANNETDVFSREPFIVRFHSPTTRTMKHHETHKEIWKK